MSTLAENVAKVAAAHAELKEAIAAKGVAVPEGTKLSGMPALVEQIETPPDMTDGTHFYEESDKASIAVPAIVFVDFTKTTKLSHCFHGCRSLTSLSLPDGFGKNAQEANYCFGYCSKLESLSLPSGFMRSGVFTDMFQGCSSLTSLTFPDGCGQGIDQANRMFQGCSSLTSLTFPEGFSGNPSSISARFSLAFSGCVNLENIVGGIKYGKSINFSECTKLTHDSLLNIITALDPITTALTLTLGATNLAKLTDAEKKIATDKGWTLA